MFNRDYLLIIDVAGRKIEIAPPMRVAFDGFKGIEGGLNRCNVKIWNLREDTRLRLIKDQEQQKRITVELLVGYKGQLQRVYRGDAHLANSKREAVDFVTEIECLDGGFALQNDRVFKAVKGKQNALGALLEDSDLALAKATAQAELTRPKIMTGGVVQQIDSFLQDGQDWFIDDGQLFILKRDGDIADRFTPVISSESGLLSTPEREFRIISFETLINPSVKLGRQVELLSTTAPHLNGRHKVFEINFSGDYDGQAWTMKVKTKAGTYAPVA